jgi:hypothetical protein
MNAIHSSWNHPDLLWQLYNEKASPKVFSFLRKRWPDYVEQARDAESKTILHRILADWEEEHDEWFRQLLILHLDELDDPDIFDGTGRSLLDLCCSCDRLLPFHHLVRKNAQRLKLDQLDTVVTFFQDLKKLKKAEPDNEEISQALKDFKFLENRNLHLKFRMAMEHLLGGPLTENGISSTICMMGTKSSNDKKLPLSIFQKGTRRIRRTNTEGRAAVAKVSTDGYVLYFKFLPELPGIEQAVSLLTHDFLGFGTTLSELFKVPSSLQIPIITSGRMYGQSIVEDSVSDCPVLVSLGIEGRTLKEVFSDPVDSVTNLNVLQNLDEYSLYAVMLMAILTNPEDGKGDNYIAEAFETKEGTIKYRIIGIDNDHAFVPPLSDAGGNRVKVNTKTVLYAFDEITKPIPQSVRKLFTVHDLESRLRGWLCQLRGINERYSELFNDSSHNRKLFEKYNSFVGIPFSKDALAYFYSKFIRLRQALFPSDQRLTPLDLFTAVEPFLSGRYGEALRVAATLSPFERFEMIEGKASIKTLSRPLDVLTSYHIPNTAESREAVLRGQHDSPGQATDELEKIMAVAFDAIQSGQLQPFKQLKLGPQIEAALQSINFGKYSSFGETDQFLKVIEDKLPLIQRLTLKYHPSISTANIKKWTEDFYRD